MGLDARVEVGISLLCPACGFDLRATTADRCGECGLTIDRDALAHGAIPWAHRRQIGRVRAYLRTVWRVATDRPSIRHEMARPQELADGRAFRRVTTAFVAAALVAYFAMVTYRNEGLVWLAAEGGANSLLGSTPRYPTWWQDAAVPWSAGATLWPVLPACLILWASFLTGAARFVLRVPAEMAQGDRRECAVALGCYATAPLALLLPAIVAWEGPPLVMEMIHEGEGTLWYMVKDAQALLQVRVLFAALLAIAAIGGTLVRTAQWAVRTRHCGGGRALLAVAEMIALWAVAAVVLVGLLPWCVGLFWVAVDSLR